ncbi:unnamed protein product, partial [Leuciscus chuanchicus]
MGFIPHWSGSLRMVGQCEREPREGDRQVNGQQGHRSSIKTPSPFGNYPACPDERPTSEKEAILLRPVDWTNGVISIE